MTAVAAPARYRFGRFELRPSEGRLLAGDQAVHLGSHAFDLLVVLLERSGHLVTKNELLERVWGKVIVEENTLHAYISALRKVLGSEAIVTVPGRGYRFACEVARVEVAPSDSSPKPKRNLPYPLTRFIGREKEIVRIKQLLRETRLLTLTGAGGCGKTRLALEVAASIQNAYPDGVFLAELAPLSDSTLIAQTIACSLSVKEQAGRDLMQTIGEWLSTKQLLLVLDNAEHLVLGCAILVDELLRRCARLGILVTSRERLGMAGELVYRVPSLRVPDAQHHTTPETISIVESACLFVDRARLQQPDFEITPDNAAALAAICRQLDGIALAIELAASRARSMSIEELHGRLDDRFRVLTDGSRTSLSRHRTLRSLIDWSYDLLSDAEKLMLQRVSVFAGGWTLEAAEQICNDCAVEKEHVFDLLSSLVDKNLILAETNAGRTRYGLLETVRQYALDRLRERDGEAQWRARHLACFVALAIEFREHMKGPKQQERLALVTSELDNLRAALAWAVESSPIEGLRLARKLTHFWLIRGHLAEGHEWLTRLLDALPIDGAMSERAHGLCSVALVAIRQGDYAEAKRLLEKGLAIFRKIGDQSGATAALDALIYLSIEQGRYPEAEMLAREAVDCARATSNRVHLFSGLGNLAIALHRQGQWAAAHELYEQSLVVARELGPWEIGSVLNEIALSETDEGRLDLALKHFTEGLTILHPLGDRGNVIESLEGLGCVAAATMAPWRAARLWGAADALRQEMGNARSVHLSIAYERQVKAVRTVLTAESFDQAWEEGLAMSLDDAVRYALDEQAGRDN